jgi:DNA-binding GntR family transcriptional regulator
MEKRSPAREARLSHPYFARTSPCDLLIEEVEAIWAAIAERDDWAALDAKIADIRLMGEALELAPD